MEKRAETIARLRALLARPAGIRADMRDFDGDKRGHYGALDEACEELSREAVNALPGILDALEAAQAEVARLRLALVDSMVETTRALEAAADRAVAAEAEVARLREALDAILDGANQAADPDFLFGAMDNVNDMDVWLHDFALAASRAIRGALEVSVRAAMEARDDRS